jgi:ABC-type Fe3+-siderophore transport system permease subunit
LEKDCDKYSGFTKVKEKIVDPSLQTYMNKENINEKNVGSYLLIISLILLIFFEISIIKIGSRIPTIYKESKLDVVTKSYPIYRVLLFTLPFLLSFSVLLMSNLFREFLTSMKILGNWRWPLVTLVFILFIIFAGKNIIGPIWENIYLVILLAFSFYASYFIYGKKKLRHKSILWIFSNPFILILIIGMLSDLMLKIISR